MYKKSMFCYMSPNNIIFNSKNGILAKAVDSDKVKAILADPDTYIDDQLCRRLILDEMIVKDTVDENEIARLQELDQVYSPRLGMIILPTENCNFNCSYCYQAHVGGKMDSTVEDAIINYLRRNIFRYTAVDIGWFGGEPLLALDTITKLSENMIAICRLARRPYSATISTNGYALNVEVFKKLLNYKVVSYQVTLDGDRQHHDQVRSQANGNGSYDTILDNLKNISEQVTSSAFSIVIRTNVTIDMLPDLENHIAHLHSIFSHDKRFSFLFRPVGDWGGNRVHLMENKFVHDMEDIYSLLCTSAYKLNHYCYYPMLVNGMCEARRRNSFVISPDGSIKKCTLVQDKEFNIVGKLLKNGEMDVNVSRLNKWIIKSSSESSKCRSCFYLAACNGSSCPLKCQAELRATDGMCGFEKENIDRVLDLLANSEMYSTINISKYY